MSDVHRVPSANTIGAPTQTVGDDQPFAADPPDPCVVELSRNSLGYWDVSNASGSRGGRFRDFKSALYYIRTEFGDSVAIIGNAQVDTLHTHH
jgi:hypothetical protein